MYFQKTWQITNCQSRTLTPPSQKYDLVFNKYPDNKKPPHREAYQLFREYSLGLSKNALSVGGVFIDPTNLPGHGTISVGI